MNKDLHNADIHRIYITIYGYYNKKRHIDVKSIRKFSMRKVLEVVRKSPALILIYKRKSVAFDKMRFSSFESLLSCIC